MAVVAPTTSANGRRYRRVVAASFTRPNDTTAYAAGDLVANSTTAASVTVANGGIMSFAVAGNNIPFEIPFIRLQKTGTTETNATFRVRLYSALPTIATTGDNGVFASVVSGFASLICTLEGSLLGHADGCAGFLVPDIGVIKPEYLQESGTLYGLLEARAAYVPSAQEVFIASLIQEFPL